ncbi:polyribonucleotide nucleotidyltransferase [Candidatus Babeliales bacterium]|nr:polyribonucleotide nucleotidyltransferase [Candidatus Babeliales bacterium]MCF7899464.1 polyribonucleotide nucleotidyltransferase [Candidatus Babeliales bacterium]
MQKKFKFSLLGLELEIGKYANQAEGSAWLKQGDNIVLSTVTSKESKSFMGFLPLTVEYREKTSAAGKIPGGYIKREGKLSDKEVLTSRLIDRPIRPLFPTYYFNEIQVLSSVYSADGKFPTDILSLLASSIALTISPIPFLGPIGAVQVSQIDGEWKFNVGYPEINEAKAQLIIAGTKDGICMVEGFANNMLESELVELFFKAHEQIKLQIDWQLEIQRELNVKKDEKIQFLDWQVWQEKVKSALPNNFAQEFFVLEKSKRAAVTERLTSNLIETFDKEIKDEVISESILQFIFDLILKKELADQISKNGYRMDMRKFDEIRPITTEVSILPCVHGSSVFTRGETQALASLTLGTAQDAQRVETLIGPEQEKSFMLHYNMPPFATGEVKPMRGVGRREIGHGYLAETSFKNVLPDREKFPYTIRSVVDVLESNGSSSMATVCSTTMALMDAGVPIADMVSGIAMGLMKDSSGNFHVLSDILGAEDAFGLMDFKLTGTKTGIMAVQMDIKDKAGLTKEILSKALEQAKKGRLHILEEMRKVMTESRKKLSDLVPRVSTLKISTDKIGAIIGPSGKTIKEIIAQTNTQIDIDDSGKVVIYAKNSEDANKASAWVNILAGEIEIGAEFEGVIRRFVEFGIFVELVPGKDGLVHISKIDKNKQRDLTKKYKIGDKLKVKVVDYDKDTGRIYLIAPDLA